jgi:hypothetical protein
MTGSANSPQEEATELLAEVLRDLTQPDHEAKLKLALRRCQFACQLLNWIEQRDWFQRELNGYQAPAEVPAHRFVAGDLVWRPIASAHQRAASLLEARLGTPDTPKEAEHEPLQLEVRYSFDHIQQLAESSKGIAFEVPHDLPTGETAEDYSPRRKRAVQLERVQRFSPSVFKYLLQRLDQYAFDFASQSYAFLRYGNALTDIWHEYRRQVDAALHGLGFTPHLEQIHVGLQSDNPEGWRTAVYECRTVLEDLANRLWLHPSKTYPYIQGGDGKDLDVSHGKFANRLGAYLHQKGARGAGGKLAREEGSATGWLDSRVDGGSE